MGSILSRGEVPGIVSDGQLSYWRLRDFTFVVVCVSYSPWNDESRFLMGVAE